MDEVADFLAHSVICQGLETAEVEELAKIFKPVRFRAGEVIVAEDARGRELYFMRSGRAQINLSGPSARDDAGTIT